MNSVQYDVDRLPLIVSFDEAALYTETYGFAGTHGRVYLEGQRLVPRDKHSDSVLLFMHPSSTLQLLPMPMALAQAGLHVMCCGSRYAKNDTPLIMEKVAVDLGAYVRYAKEVLGYQNVVLMGWSGGGSLSLFYQSQAEAPDIVATPAGDPIDLAAADLPPVDAIVLVAAHKSRAKTLTEWLDPSVSDEQNPDQRLAEFDLYDPKNANQPPYQNEFLVRYRQAQIERNRRITRWVREMLAELNQRDGAEKERGFVVHRTMADPRWLDPSVDPNDRRERWCYLGDPQTVNVGPVGLARFCTLRAWLSQWSYDDSRADGPTNVRSVSVPLLMIENSADDAVPRSHGHELFTASASADKHFEIINGATHYYKDQPAHLVQAVRCCANWLRERDLI